MSAVTFDTLKFVDTLEQAQLPRDQARAIAAAVQSAQQAAELATKADLREYESAIRHDLEKLDLGLRKEMDVRFAKVDSELKLQRALLTAALGGIVAILVRSFF